MRVQAHLPWGLAFVSLLLGGCGDYPRDPARSLDRIRAHGTIRVGVEQALPPEGLRLLARIERAAGAKARLRKGSLEPLLASLEAGEIDLVVARFGRGTPWAATSALSPPIRSEGGGERVVEWRAAMRSGENRWIMLVERAARAEPPA